MSNTAAKTDSFHGLQNGRFVFPPCLLMVWKDILKGLSKSKCAHPHTNSTNEFSVGDNPSLRVRSLSSETSFAGSVSYDTTHWLCDTEQFS